MDDSNQMLAIGGALCAGLAAVAWFADHRRYRREDLDRVGCMPWTTLFFWAMTAAVILLGLSARSAFGR